MFTEQTIDVGREANFALGEVPQKRRLAVSVRPDETVPPPVCDLELRVDKQVFALCVGEHAM